MLQGEHSAILLTFIKLPFVLKIFVLSIFSGRFTQILLYVQPDARTLYIPEHLHTVVYTSVCSKPLFKHGVTIDDVLYYKKTK